MTRNTWLSLAVAAGLVLALPGVASASGCCQYKDSCEKTDDADACKAAGGHHFQLAPCDGKTCHPTASGDPTGWVSTTCPVLPRAATAQAQQQVQASSAGFDCVTKDGEFCRGELGKGNHCVSTTDCTPTQLAECLPGFPMCPTAGPTPVPES